MNVQLQPYVFFSGNCEEAITFYAEKVFPGAKVSVMRYEGAPMEIPKEFGNKVMHASLTIGETVLMAADAMPGQPVDEGMRAHISVGVDTPEEGAKCFNALAEGGTVVMPYEAQFWGDTYGMVTDRFGIKWMVNAAGTAQK